MRVTLDTNSLISATFWYGDSFRIVSMAEDKKISLVLSEEIIKEFSSVLSYEEIKKKIQAKNLEIKRTVAKIATMSLIVKPKQKFDDCSDPKDNMVLDCAYEGKVDYMVTNDKHLLKLENFKGIRIVTPAEFLSLI
ncbi:MAG TPA: putative toxin-antitoxin system toxin component, PIN family [Candidatus Nanoarchaeia archaeon]|nr:putative toxin-antitoxin system toxin component, PIN family [Candidatus Nanoarchaeia archaeon]